MARRKKRKKTRKTGDMSEWMNRKMRCVRRYVRSRENMDMVPVVGKKKSCSRDDCTPLQRFLEG